jgi:hypothetical protein
VACVALFASWFAVSQNRSTAPSRLQNDFLASKLSTTGVISLALQIEQGLFKLMDNSIILASPLVFLPSLDDFIGSIQHRLRNRQADLLGGFEIDHQLKLRRLLDREIGWLGSLQDLVN